MRQGQRLHFYEYLDRPFEAVRTLFAANAIDALTHATDEARNRVLDLSEHLSVDVGALEIGAPITVKVTSFEQSHSSDASPSCRLRIEWTGSKHPGLFPSMKAELEAHPVTPRETQLAFFGEYLPPLGAVGRGVDLLLGHRLAEASVHSFVRALAERLRRLIPPDKDV